MSKRKEYRFSFHYHKQRDMMSVHFRKACFLVKDVQCLTSCVSKYNKTQPRLVMQGWAKEVIIPKGSKTAIIV